MRRLKLASMVIAASAAAGIAAPANAYAALRVAAASSATWAGYAGSAPNGKTIKSANVTFTVPKVKCSGSIGPPAKSKLYPGWHASFWVGIDGWNPAKKLTNGTVQQVGVIAFCKTRKSTATYRPFYEMFPAGPVLRKESVRAGNQVTVDVSVSGRSYTFGFTNVTTGTGFTAKARCAKKTKCRNSTAEVVTEAPGGGPNAGHGLAETGTAVYTNAAVSLSGSHFGFALGLLPRITKITMSPKRHPGIVRPGKIGGLAGPTNFKTFWR